MNLKITGSETGNNKGSCGKLVEYLEKENLEKDILEKRFFFNDAENGVNAFHVQSAIDTNHHKLGKNDAKFFMLVISPSEKELHHIGCDEQKLMDYTRSVMDEYAANFNKGLMGQDLLWFAKIEEFRKDKDKEQLKPGPQWHIHVIVSRYDKGKRFKLSPLTNHKNTDKGMAKGGFNRNEFRQNGERAFDTMFNYTRDYSESWEFQNTMKNGNIEDKHFVKTKLANKHIAIDKDLMPDTQSKTSHVVQKALSAIGKANKMTSHEEEEEEKKSRGKGMGL